VKASKLSSSGKKIEKKTTYNMPETVPLSPVSSVEIKSAFHIFLPDRMMAALTPNDLSISLQLL
jgi:hypothetical protein